MATSKRKLRLPHIDYVGCDVVDGENVDVVPDAHRLSKALDRTFDYVYSISTFEHLLMPWVVATEINHVMNIGGVGYIQSHQMWPVHDVPSDYFRFLEVRVERALQ